MLIWEISAQSIRTNSENTIKMVENILITFATAIALFTLVTLLIKLIRIFQKRKYKQDLNYAILVAMLRKQSYFCLKNVVPVTGLKRSHGKRYSADTNISVAKTAISASPAFHMKKSNFLQRKEWWK